ncbi:hypothetical protein B0H14DRAFT_2236293, partial [Mycena olivaceomarginata]
GVARFRNLGAGYIMPDDVLHRIVDCARHHKIQNIEDLLKETRWHRVSEDGERVLALISEHRPLPPPPTMPATTPLRPIDANSPTLRTPSTPSVRKCRQCGQSGHI